MLKEVYEIDENGFIFEIYVKDLNEEDNHLEELAKNIITIQPPNGLYRAKWTGTEWVEGMSQDEINILNNQPQLPTAEERLKMAEDTLVFLLIGGM